MRAIGGTGTGNGPWITFHDGFIPFGNTSVGGFEGLLNGFDRVSLDSHRYLCFDTQNEWGLQYQASLVRPRSLFVPSSPLHARSRSLTMPERTRTQPCQYWSTNMNISTNTFGLTMGGEWSLASASSSPSLSLSLPPRPGPTADGPPSLRATVNDCGKWLNNVGNGERFEGTYYIPGNTTAPSDLFPRVGDCAPWRVSCSFSFYSSSSSRASRRLRRRRRRRALLLTLALVDRRAGLPHLEPDDQGRPSPRRRDAHGRSSCASHLLSLSLARSSSLVAGTDVVRLLARSTGSSGRGRRATRRRSA